MIYCTGNESEYIHLIQELVAYCQRHEILSTDTPDIELADYVGLTPDEWLVILNFYGTGQLLKSVVKLNGKTANALLKSC
jgi:hypothetical protein